MPFLIFIGMNVQKTLEKKIYPLLINAYEQGGTDYMNNEFNPSEFADLLKKKGVQLLSKAQKKLKKK